MIQTDLAIVGAGPVGLFAVFEAGLLKMRCHLIDALPQIGGQLSEIYPKKPIYDIPGFPSVLAGELVDRLAQQIEPFSPTFTLGERVQKLTKVAERQFILETNLGTKIEAKAVVIAAGLGSFEPRKPAVADLERFENGKGVYYMVLDPERFRGKKLAIAGGGDSALDWSLYLADLAEELTLIHRSESFRAAPDSVRKLMELVDQGKIRLELNSEASAVVGNEKLEAIEITNTQSKEKQWIELDSFLPLFGLSPKLGPLENWGLEIEKGAIKVRTEDYQTNVPGIYAIGDINTYTNKLKLILCGFHEAALMSHSAYQYIHPGTKYTMKYTTVQGVHAF